MGRQQKLADQRHGTILPRRQLRSFRLRNSDRSVKTYATDALSSNVPVSFNGKTAETCRSAARDDFAEEAAPVVPTAELWPSLVVLPREALDCDSSSCTCASSFSFKNCTSSALAIYAAASPRRSGQSG